jgi:hypothetical protein
MNNMTSGLIDPTGRPLFSDSLRAIFLRNRISFLNPR